MTDKKTICLLLLLTLQTHTLPTWAGAGPIHVDADAVDSGSNDGSSWALAFTNLQDALAAASLASEIWVAQGVYYPDEGLNQVDNEPLSTFYLRNEVKVYGGFSGTETLFSERDPDQFVTVLSGDIEQNDLNTDGNFVAEQVSDIQGTNAFHVVTNDAAELEIVMDGFTITAGKAIDQNVEDSGAGFHCASLSNNPHLNQMRLIGNHARLGGAVSTCNLTATNSAFINNHADLIGGAIFARVVLLDQVSFIGNSAARDGGAIFFGINIPQPMVINNSQFLGNWTATDDGGALFIGTDVFIESSLFAGNRATDGGAIYVAGMADLTITNSTVAGNRADLNGGGMGFRSNGNFTLFNSIVWNNMDASGIGTAKASIHDPSQLLSHEYSLVQDYGVAGIGNLDQDPLFLSDTDPSQAPIAGGNHRLSHLSPVINVGDNSRATVQLDLDGEPRIQAAVIDFGAYEGFTDLIFAAGFEGPSTGISN